MKIPITKPFFDEEERASVIKPIESGWLVQGRFVSEFEDLFAAYTGAKHAKATSNCTTALHLALVALGIGRGDKVIVPSFTYVASANAVEYTGAQAVFCDIDLRTFTMDLQQVEDVLQKDAAHQIKAVMPVNLFGLCADLPGILRLADTYSLKVVEDSACGLGAYIGSKHSGTFGDAGCFSFHPRKSITTGEGGMLITENDTIDEAVGSLRNHGASESDLARHKGKGGYNLPAFNIIGYNYRMTDIQGAIGVCQMRKASYILEQKRSIASRYDDALKDASHIMTPYTPAGYTHGFQAYVCLYTGGENISRLSLNSIDKISADRNRFMAFLEERGISTRQGTHAVHALGYYKSRYNLREDDYLMSYAADRLSLAIPLFPGLTDQEFDYIVENMKKGMP